MKNALKRLSRYAAEIYFLFVALVIMLPLLREGYILLLDMTFTPKMNYSFRSPFGLYNEAARDAVLNIASQIIGSQLLEKLLLFTLLFMTGYFMFRLLKHLKVNIDVALVGATLYLWNPFIYSRLLAGHWAFIFGYALLPIFLIFFNKYLSRKRFSNTYLISAALLWFAASLISIHHLFIYFIPSVAITFAHMLQTKNWEGKIARLVSICAFVTLFSFSWFLPTILSGEVSRIDNNNLQFFASTPDLKYGLSTNLLGMYGFWAENTIGETIKPYLSIWPVISISLVIISAASLLLAKQCCKKNQYLFIVALAGTGFIGFVLAHGSYGIMQPFWDFFFVKIPLLQMFRDSQKFLSLYVLALSILLPFSIGAIADSVKIYKLSKESKIRGLSILLVLLIILVNPFMGFAAAGQMKISDYPDSWYQLEDKVISEQRPSKILMLPWLAYAKFGFSDKQIANPGSKFFSAYVIAERIPALLKQPTNCEIEFKEYYRGEIISLCLNSNSANADWINQIKSNGIDYVVINKIKGFEVNDFYNDKEHFQKLFTDDYTEIYEVL